MKGCIGWCAVLLTLVVLSGGCAAMGEHRDLFRPAGLQKDAAWVLRESRRIGRLAEAERRVEYRRLQQNAALPGGEEAGLVLACVVLLPQSSFDDPDLALRRVQEARRRTDLSEDLLALAELLEALILQQQQLKRELGTERERSGSLADKLRALEDIEKIIQEREQKALPLPR